MRKTLSVTFAAFAIMLALFSFASSAIDTIACEINEIKMSIAVPADMPFVTRESKESDAYFSTLKLDYDQIMENFQEGNIYLQAMKTDKSLTLTVSSEVNESSQKADNFNKLSDDALAEVKSAYLGVKNSDFKSGSVVEYNGIKYICFVRKGDTGCDYNTVVNGRDYHIHFQTKNDAKMTAGDRELIESVVKGTGIIEDNFVNNNRDFLLYGGVTLFGILLVIAVVVIVVKKTKSSRTNRRHSHLVHELAHEHKITDTTRIPRKRIEDITEPTMTFLNDYEPIEEKDDVKPYGRRTAAANAETATFVSVSPEEIEGFDDGEDISAIAAEAKKAAADEMAARMQQDAVELPKPVYEEEPTPVENDEQGLETAESAEQSFGEARDYFDDEAVNIYSSGSHKPRKPAQPAEEAEAVEAVEEAQDVEDYEVDHYDVDFDSEDYEEDEHYESHIADNTKLVFAAIGRALAKFFKALGRGLAKFFKALGKGLLSVLGTIWTVIIFIVVHCKYFCINLSRAIKRKRNIKKHQKLQQKRREQSQQQHRDELAQRRAQRNAARARQEANSRRGANDLVQVHSREERRPTRRPASRPSDRTAYPRNRRS